MLTIIKDLQKDLQDARNKTVDAMKDHIHTLKVLKEVNEKCDKYELALKQIADPHGIGDQPYSEICAMFLRIARKALGK